MQSRLPYKRLLIEFAPDECTGPLPAGRQFGSSMGVTNRASKASLRSKPAHPGTNALANRFDLLNMDGDEASSENVSPRRRIDDSDEIDDDDQSGVSLG